MDEGLMRERVARARVARLATTTGDGRPHIVPCCFALEDDRLYTAVDDIKAKSSLELRRIDNVRLHPHVSVLVDHYTEAWADLWWIRMDGSAHVALQGSPEHRVAIGSLASKYDQYRGRPPPGAAVVVEVETWRGWP